MEETPRQTTIIELEAGKTNVLKFNFPAKFRVEFVSGTYIDGWITPNNPLEICPFGDIKSITVEIRDEYMQRPRILEQDEEQATCR